MNTGVRMMITYKYCYYLLTFALNINQAKHLALQFIEAASDLNHNLSNNEFQLLQKLRTDVLMSPIKSPIALLGGTDEFNDQYFFARKKSVKFADLDRLRDQRTMNQSTTNQQRLEVALRLKKVFNIGQYPLLLESIPSSSNIFKAIDKIFRTYIKGNALPGQLASGQTVDLAGQVVSFRHFVLDGPYMSWKGFVQFLADFNIVNFPHATTTTGKKFWRTMSNHNISIDSLSNINEGNEPLLSMKEAALIFIQCSHTSFPLFTSRRIVMKPQENADQIEINGWKLVYSYAENISDSEWIIDVGTNFIQFVDCLGVSITFLVLLFDMLIIDDDSYIETGIIRIFSRTFH
jgi:hypothetical protein